MSTRTLTVVLAGDAKGAAKAFDTVEKKSGGLSGALGKLASAAKAATVVAGAAAVAVGATSVKAYAEFEDRMTKSLAIQGDVSERLRSQMEDAARAVAKTTTFSAGEAADAYFYLASAGLDAAQQIDAMPRVASFASAGNFDLARATDLLTDAQSALGLASDDAAENLGNLNRVGDVLVKANTLANASVEQFSASLTNKAAAAARQVGKDVEETTAVLAVFADQGVKGEQAGTMLASVLDGMSRAALNNEEAWSDLGVSVFDADGNFRSMEDISRELTDALGPLSAEQQAAALQALGLNKQAADGTRLLLGNADALAEYDAALRDAGGTMDAVAANQLQSFSAQWQLMTSRLADIGLTIGSILVPMLADLLSWVGDRVMPVVEDFVDRVLGPWATKQDEAALAAQGLAHEIQTVITPVERLAAVGRDLLTALEPTIEAALGVRDSFAELSGEVSGSGGMERVLDLVSRLGDVVLGLLPSLVRMGGALGEASAKVGFSAFGIFLTILESLAGVMETVLVPAVERLAGWMENNETAVFGLVAAFTAWRVAMLGINLAGLIASITTAIIAKGKLAVASVTSAATVVKSWIAKGVAAAGAAASFVSTITVIIGAYIKLGIQALLAAGRVALSWVIAFAPIALVIAAVAGLVYVLIRYWDDIKEGVAAAWNWITERTGEAWEWLKDLVLGAVESVRETMSAAWTSIKEAAGEAWQWVKDTVAAVADFLVDLFLNWTLAGIILSNWDTIKEAAQAAWSWIRDTVVGFAENLRDRVVGAVTTLRETVTRVWNTVLSAATKVWNAIRNGVASRVQAMRDRVVTAVTGLRTRVQSTINGLRTRLFSVFGTIRDGIRSRVNAVRTLVTNVFSTMRSRVFSIASGLVNGFRTRMSGLVSAVKRPINGVISALNSFVRGFNRLIPGGFRIPDIPGIPGRGTQVSFPQMRTIPRLHTGGRFYSGSSKREGLALLKDGERVLSNEQQRSQADPFGAKGGPTIGQMTIHVRQTSATPSEIAQEVAWRMKTAGV